MRCVVLLILFFIIEIYSTYVVGGIIDSNRFSYKFNTKLNNSNHKKSVKSGKDKFYDIQENALLTTPELIVKHGYPVEIHNVTTEDGYILEVHRMPRNQGKPILLQHGLLDSSAAFILMGPQQGFAYLLWELGYDVWMGNSRGNRYSKRHKNLDSKDERFWSFSWHEMGMYDMPATIDYILNATQYSKLYYVGHSQGTTIFWVMCSERPEYNKKVAQMHAFAPVAFLTHVRGAGMLLRYTLNILEFTSSAVGIREIFPVNPVMVAAGMAACQETAITQRYCSDLLFLLAGYDYEQMNKTMLPVIYGHIPAGSSLNQLLHYGQLIRSGKFCQYDFGFFWNLIKYSRPDPPCYNLKKVLVPVHLYYSLNDYLSSPEDVQKLSKLLPNVVEKYQVPMEIFNHLDFIWGIDSKSLLYDHVIEMMRKDSNEVILLKN